MTTNRTEDVDEAIVSRCSAVLSYKKPEVEARRKLWELFIGNFNLDVTSDTIDKIVEEMKDISVRDIKNICSLASKYMQGDKHKGHKVDWKVFKTCATFRGMYEIA